MARTVGQLVRSNGPALGALGAATLAELSLLDRALFVDPKQYGFVVANVDGVLSGTPAYKAWAHRQLGPRLIRALEHVTTTPLAAVQTFTHLAVWAANLVLFGLLRRQGARPWRAFVACAAFAGARYLLTFRLEYPWDGVDVLLFLVFGHAAASGWSLSRSLPLLLVGAFNHETVLYLPAWFLLAPLERGDREGAWRDVARAAAALVALAASIVALRAHFYVGRPPWKDQVFEPVPPIIENPVHVFHNLRQLFVEDFTHGRSAIALVFFAAVAAIVRGILRHRHLRASWWTAGVLATIVVFGYVNETRLYLPLLSFWFAYAAGELASARVGVADALSGRAN